MFTPEVAFFAKSFNGQDDVLVRVSSKRLLEAVKGGGYRDRKAAIDEELENIPNDSRLAWEIYMRSVDRVWIGSNSTSTKRCGKAILPAHDRAMVKSKPPQSGFQRQAAVIMVL